MGQELVFLNGKSNIQDNNLIFQIHQKDADYSDWVTYKVKGLHLLSNPLNSTEKHIILMKATTGRLTIQKGWKN